MGRTYPSEYEEVDPGKKLRIFGEDEASSGSDDGLDIIASSRKGLDLSQYIDALTQSQTQSQTQTQEIQEVAETADEASDEPDSDWDADPQATYKAFKASKTLKRKATAAETNRIRAKKKSRIANATSVIGRKKPQVKSKQSTRALYHLSAGSGDEEESGEETFLAEPIPDYIKSRKAKLQHLQHAGLRYPPSYDDMYFSDSDSEEKPAFSSIITPQQAKRDIDLPKSSGIIPAPIAQWLRDYQVEGTQFLHENFVRQTGAILGDDMGLGKTIQVIAFLTAAFGKTAAKPDAKRMRKWRRRDKRLDDTWYPRILIICPGSLMYNWEEEFSTWGWWDVQRYHGPKSELEAVLRSAKQGMTEIMITTYTTYRNHESEINTIKWDCVVADECHTIKNRNSEIAKALNKVNALCRIGLTGTAVQNKYEELWTLLNWARPGAYGSAQEWKQLVCLPLKMGQAHDVSFAQLAAARDKAKELVDVILPDVFLRRMKTLIAHQLPKKSDRVVFCQLTNTQADAYRAFLESDQCEFIRMAKEECDCNSGKKRGWCCYKTLPDGGRWDNYVFPCMITLQKIANHLALIVPNTSDVSEKQAKDLDNLQIACPSQWKKLYTNRDSVLNLTQRNYCGKWKVLKRLLDFWHSNGDKVLIFSHSVRLLRLLRALFDIDGTNYNFSYLDGSMKYEDRAKAVADFNSDPNQFVFLISTKAGGVGLNITSANKVVVMDPNWNPAYDLQAQDRAYRIGQMRDVEVFRLVSAGTIEEIVYARQIYKQQQANIAYTASDERRYFKGVMDGGKDGKNGELFGLENLFSFNEDGLVLRDIVHKTNVAEIKANVKILDYDINGSEHDTDEDEDLLNDQSLGIVDDDGSAHSQIAKFLEPIIGDVTDSMMTKPRGRKNIAKRKGPDPVLAILAKAGVQYTHENSEVIGHSKIEAQLSRKAKDLRNDIEYGSKRVFQLSQSQSQSRHHHRALELEGVQSTVYTSEDDDDDGDSVHEIARSSRARKGELKINYKYRPNSDIRRRQFCSMAETMGYDNPVDFAVDVEQMTTEQRMTTLDRFYRRRGRDLDRELGGEVRGS